MTLGMDAFAIGVPVALATGTPELATTLVARPRGHHEVELGNLYGSNTFNGLLIVAVVALIAPIAVTWREIAVGHLLTTALTWPVNGHLWRGHGIILLIVYVCYLVQSGVNNDRVIQWVSRTVSQCKTDQLSH